MEPFLESCHKLLFGDLHARIRLAETAAAEIVTTATQAPAAGY
jgi:hypothetical protein